MNTNHVPCHICWLEKIPHPRRWCYIYNSRVDFIDGWLSFLVFILGIYLLIVQPVEKIEYYHFLEEQGFGSIVLGSFSTLVGLSNIIRIFVPVKTNIFLTVAMKCLTLAICLLMFFSILANTVVPIASIFYGMVSILAFDNVKRSV
jgi:hypothetical protein